MWNQTGDLQIFSSVLCWLFILLITSFLCTSFLVWFSPTCWFLLLSLVLLMSYSKTIIAKTNVKELSPVFSSGSVNGFRSYTSVLNSFWVNVCEWCNIGVRFLFFFFFLACGYPGFPTLLIKETVLSPLCILVSLPLSNISWPYMCEFISGLLTPSHWSVCFYATATLFWNQKVWYFQLCSFSWLLWPSGIFCVFI